MSLPGAARVVVVEPPTAAPRPLLVEIPHAGLFIPSDIRADLAIDDDRVRRDADLYVDRLYARATSLGATVVRTEISRFVVDLNRARGDVDRQSVPDHPSPRPDAPRGLIWRLATDGTPALRHPLSLAAWRHRVEHYHRPYHHALDEQVARLQARFGFVIVLSGHSMPSVGRMAHVDLGRRRADVVPGDRKGQSCDARIMRAASALFSEAGLSVVPNDPYQGGETTRRLGRPTEGVHAIQIELNRQLYMDEQTMEPQVGGFERIEALCASLVDRIGRMRM